MGTGRRHAAVTAPRHRHNTSGRNPHTWMSTGRRHAAFTNPRRRHTAASVSRRHITALPRGV